MPVANAYSNVYCVGGRCTVVEMMWSGGGAGVAWGCSRGGVGTGCRGCLGGGGDGADDGVGVVWGGVVVM